MDPAELFEDLPPPGPAGARSRARAGAKPAHAPETAGPASSVPRVLRAEDFPEGPPRGPGICGIDEAGRGPLAGPVYAAAALLPADFPLDCLDDSKALTEKRRDAAFLRILEGSVAWAIDWASPTEIDERNILQASLLAMERAYARLAAQLASRGLPPPEKVYIDGNRLPALRRPAQAVIKGDAILPAIMAASILAKVARDRAMERLDWLYPEYGYARHKGYPTAEHRERCRELGPSPCQRLSFHYERT